MQKNTRNDASTSIIATAPEDCGLKFGTNKTSLLRYFARPSHTGDRMNSQRRRNDVHLRDMAKKNAYNI